MFGWGRKKKDGGKAAEDQQSVSEQPRAKERRVTKVLILYYSSYGHVETMARAVAEGVRQAPGGEPTIKRVAELVPPDVAAKAGVRVDQEAPFADPGELGDYDAIIVGSPTRFGNMSAQMRNFWDQTGALWMKHALRGKAGAAFTSTASQHGGQEMTIQSIHTTLLHHGMVIVGLPYSWTGNSQMHEISGGTPYGASTIAGADGSRQPSANELEGARYQGRHVTEIASRLAAHTQ
jgi:NAD(P)H dehydrogenase (quinone)